MITIHHELSSPRAKGEGQAVKAPSHKDLVKAIKNLITEHGGFVYKHYSGGSMGLNGVSDLIGCYKGKSQWP
jgi:hypothetical protein